MKKYTLLVLLALVAGISICSAQDDEEEKRGFDKSKLFVGGNFGLSFGDYSLANVSPQLGYRFNQYFAAGAGVNFLYSSSKYRDFNGNALYKTSYGVAGLNVFGRVYPIQYLLLQAQPEMNYTWGKYKYYNNTPSEKIPGAYVPSLLLGGGAIIPSGIGGFIIMVQLDVLNNKRSPYGNRPIYNFGYNVGL
ncbi:MAG: hypothetical protein INR73_10190 [Williamsia sp.]|nr:hypothetical protein [Williamsia sp.]